MPGQICRAGQMCQPGWQCTPGTLPTPEPPSKFGTPCLPGERCLTHGLWDALGEHIGDLPGRNDHAGDARELPRVTQQLPFLQASALAQKFELSIDLEYEDPDLSIVPDLGGERRTSVGVEEFSFDASSLDTLFTELTPAPAIVSAASGFGASEPFFGRSAAKTAAGASRQKARVAARSFSCLCLLNIPARSLSPRATSSRARGILRVPCCYNHGFMSPARASG